MNRYIRRAQEKSDKKREKERGQRRGPRKTQPKKQAKSKADKPKKAEAKRDDSADNAGNGKAESSTANSGRAESSTANSSRAEKKGKTRAGRFAGFLALATAFLIVSQAFVSFESFSPTDYAVIAFSYVLLGYFTSLWLLRRSTENAIAITVMAGILLSFGIELSRLLRPEVTAYPLLVFASAPALLIGVTVARFVHKRSPAA